MNKITLTQAYDIIFKDYPDVVGVKKLSDMLGIGSKKVYELLRIGKIPAIPCGKKYMVAKINVIEYLFNNNIAA